MGIRYVTRESVMDALEFGESSRLAAQVDRAIEGASREAEGITNRVFYPVSETRYFDWPARNLTFPWRLWFDDSELVSASLVTTGSIVIPSTGYFLEPANDGPPYDSVEINLSSQSAFTSAAAGTFQRAVAIDGTWGYDFAVRAAGSLASAISNSDTTITVTDGTAVGVGDLLVIGSEMMVTTASGWLDSGQTLQTAMTSSMSATTLAVSDGTLFAEGERLLLDSEKMLITDIAGNTLIVKRAQQGSVLTAHTGSTIYARRSFTVERGACGTVAASQSGALTAKVYPGDLVTYVTAEAINTVLSEGAGYARTIGSGEGVRNASGQGVKDARERLWNALARKSRHRAV